MASALANIAPKLAKLLPMLSTDHDGEVVATARAIGRTLRSAGLDWHALANAVTAQPALAAPAWQAPRSSAPASAPKAPPRWRDLSSGERVMAMDRLPYAGFLSAWERQFALSIEAKLRVNPYVRLTDRQTAILDQLLAREWEETGCA